MRVVNFHFNENIENNNTFSVRSLAIFLNQRRRTRPDENRRVNYARKRQKKKRSPNGAGSREFICGPLENFTGQQKNLETYLQCYFINFETFHREQASFIFCREEFCVYVCRSVFIYFFTILLIITCLLNRYGHWYKMRYKKKRKNHS